MTTMTTRQRAEGGTEAIHAFDNGRRARVTHEQAGVDAKKQPVHVYAVQLLDCRNDEHENRLFKRREGLDEAGVKKALAEIAKLRKPTPNKWDR